MEQTIFNKNTMNVLVDANEGILEFMKLKTRTLNIGLARYKNPEDFLSDLNRPIINESMEFYFSKYFGFGRGITGKDLAKAVKTRFPNAKVYLVTKCSEAGLEKELAEGLIDLVIPKMIFLKEPYDMDQLSDMQLNRLLDLGELLKNETSFGPINPSRDYWLSRVNSVRALDRAWTPEKPISRMYTVVPPQPIMTTESKSWLSSVFESFKSWINPGSKQAVPVRK